jgi:hypothetical protein
MELDPAEAGAEKISGSGDTGKFQLFVSGSRVQSVEGLR